jgi:hypothetical protein
MNKVNPDAVSAKSPPTLSAVVPTYRESANVPVLFEPTKAALDGLRWAMIVVDPAQDVRSRRGRRRQSRDWRAGPRRNGCRPVAARQKLSDLGRWFFNKIAGAAVSDPRRRG